MKQRSHTNAGASTNRRQFLSNASSTLAGVAALTGGVWSSASAAESTAASEFQETFDKVNRILPILAKLGKQGI